jgi:chemotaxis response regulator CheB
MPKNILIVEDSFIMRTLIQDIVQSDPEFTVVGMAENGKVGLQKVRELKPDLVLLDIEMPEMTGPRSSSCPRSARPARRKPSRRAAWAPPTSSPSRPAP